MKSFFLNVFLFLIASTFYANSSAIKGDTLQLENEYLSIKIKTKGAELISIFNKKEKFEHLWQGEQGSWNQQSPILFPIVGKLKNKIYLLDDKTYKMENHGFAFKQNFKLISQTNTQIVLALKETDETLKTYPFKFILYVTYTLKDNRLLVENKGVNTDTKEIYFSIGAHPGFNIPFSSDENYDDYYLEFEKNETVARLPLIKVNGFLSHQKTEKYLDNTSTLHLNHQLFKDRVVILEDLKSETVTIKSDTSKMSVTIGIANFPFLGIWTSYQKEAPFICIEPWYGISDYETTSGDFKTKKGIQSLQTTESFLMNYFIEIE